MKFYSNISVSCSAFKARSLRLLYDGNYILNYISCFYSIIKCTYSVLYCIASNMENRKMKYLSRVKWSHNIS